MYIVPTMDAIKNFFGSKTFSFLFQVLILATFLLALGWITQEIWKNIIDLLIGTGTARGSLPHVQNLFNRKQDEIQKVVSADSDVQLAARVVARTDKSP